MMKEQPLVRVMVVGGSLWMLGTVSRTFKTLSLWRVAWNASHIIFILIRSHQEFDISDSSCVWFTWGHLLLP